MPHQWKMKIVKINRRWKFLFLQYFESFNFNQVAISVLQHWKMVCVQHYSYENLIYFILFYCSITTTDNPNQASWSDPYQSQYPMITATTLPTPSVIQSQPLGMTPAQLIQASSSASVMNDTKNLPVIYQSTFWIYCFCRRSIYSIQWA